MGENICILLSKNATIVMDNNIATEYGGAVYVEDSNPIAYYVTPSNLTHAVTAYYNIYIHFYNNHAQIVGSAVYGGAMDICKIHVEYNTTTDIDVALFRMYDILNIEMVENSVSSDPFRVCPCENGI